LEEKKEEEQAALGSGTTAPAAPGSGTTAAATARIDALLLKPVPPAEAQRYYRPAEVLPLDPAVLPMRREPARVGGPYPLPTYPL